MPHVSKHGTNAGELQDLIQRVLHHPDFNADDVDHDLQDDQRLGDASADTQRDRDNSSRLYEVNIWMWRYGRGLSRMVSIAEAERIRIERVSESRQRRLPKAAAGRIEHWPMISYVIS